MALITSKNCINYCILLICATFFQSCDKKELPVPTYNRGDMVTSQIEMTSNYKYQLWFNLEENKVVSINNKTDWDIAFETSPSGKNSILNSSKAMRAFKTNYTNLSEVNDTIGLAVNGKPNGLSIINDSTIINSGEATNTVYIINRGYNENGKQLGYLKLKIHRTSESLYDIEYADIYETKTVKATINKNADYNYVAYSFNTHNQLYIEPKKTKYDLCFTQYTHTFYNPLHYYQVTGVLHNYFNTKVAIITNKLFADITITDTVNSHFSAAINTIGYDWKLFNINANTFTVDANKCYIIQNNKGFFYKLHFIDFYDSKGIKGYPKFEYKKI